MIIKTADASIKNDSRSSLPQSVSAPKHLPHLKCEIEIAPLHFRERSTCDEARTRLDVYDENHGREFFVPKGWWLIDSRRRISGSDSGASKAENATKQEGDAGHQSADCAQGPEAEISGHWQVHDGRPRGDIDADSADDMARPRAHRDGRHEAVSCSGSSASDVPLSSRRLASGRNDDFGRGKNDSDRGRSSNLGRDESRGQEAPTEAKGQLLIQYEWVLLARHCEATGDTKDAVYARRKTRTWTEGVQSKRVGKKIYVNPLEYNAWVKKSK